MIDRVYIICNRKDFYFATISVVAVRHWNNEIAITLIKDETYGSFNSTKLEATFHVTVAATALSKMGFYAMLWPFFEATKQERFFILDADTIWLGDMVKLMNDRAEELVVQPYTTPDMEAEKLRWFFDEQELKKIFPTYHFPGYVFNVGQMICNSNTFSKRDFESLLIWKNNPEPIHKNLFFYEQGMLNYLAATKQQNGSITVGEAALYKWPADAVNKDTEQDFFNNKEKPYLLHYAGPKWGLFTLLPAAGLLKQLEKIYYQKSSLGLLSMYIHRLQRTLINPHRYAYHFIKKIFRIK